jgi:hypothetical protein
LGHIRHRRQFFLPTLQLLHERQCQENHTPAMAHGLATEVWTVRKMIEMVTA